MPDLAEICSQCKAEHEKSLAELRAENERKSQPAMTFDQQYVLDLVGQMAAAWRHKFDSLAPGIQEIIKAWDKANNKQPD